MKKHLSSSTAILAIIVGVLCPLCIIAPLLLTAGLGSVLALVAPWLAPVLLILVGISLIGFFLSYRVHKNPLSLVLTILAGGLMYYGRYINYDNTIAFTGGGLLIGAIILDWWVRKNSKECLVCKINPNHHERR